MICVMVGYRVVCISKRLGMGGNLINLGFVSQGEPSPSAASQQSCRRLSGVSFLGCGV